MLRNPNSMLCMKTTTKPHQMAISTFKCQFHDSLSCYRVGAGEPEPQPWDAICEILLFNACWGFSLLSISFSFNYKYLSASEIKLQKVGWEYVHHKFWDLYRKINRVQLYVGIHSALNFPNQNNSLLYLQRGGGHYFSLVSTVRLMTWVYSSNEAFHSCIFFKLIS